VSTLFVSHATLDKPIVDGLVDLVTGGCGLAPAQIFCSSTEGTTVEPGLEFWPRILNRLRETALMILVVTPDYRKSHYCALEMGAASALGIRVIPLTFTPEDADPGGVLAGVQSVRCNAQGLDALRDLLATVWPSQPTARWTVKRDEFLQRLPALVSRHSSSQTPSARRGRAGRPSAVTRFDLATFRREALQALEIHVREERPKGRTAIVGWPHLLTEHRVSMIGTAYGLRIAKAARAASSRLPTERILETLRALRLDDGGWNASSQAAVGRLLPTVFAISAFDEWGCFTDVTDASSRLALFATPERDQPSLERTYIVASALRLLADMDPTNELVAILAARLCDGRIAGDVAKWRDHLSPAGSGPPQRPTVLHTAHAALALATCHRRTGGRTGLSPNDLAATADWLLSVHPWSDASERVFWDRVGGGRDVLAINHFAAPWVILALLELGRDTQEQAIRSAVREIVARRSEGVWEVGPFGRPIWAILDALDALTAYCLRSGCA
jgi:hypothetical protein